MSNGIASGVPPEGGWAGGVAGAGVCAKAAEPSAARAQAARVIETSGRIGSSVDFLATMVCWNALATPFSCNYSEIHLFDPDIRVPDHLAPALLLAAHIAIEFGRFGCDHDQTLIHAEPFEGIGPYRRRGGFVQTIDNIGRCSGRRVEAVPAFRRIAGHPRL